MSHDVMLHVLMLHDAHACDAMRCMCIVCRVRVPTIMLTSCISIARDDDAMHVVCARVPCVHVMQQHARVCG